MKYKDGTEVVWRPLGTRVIIVAKEKYPKEWCAYIGAVAGNSHEEEWEEVLLCGDSLDERTAKFLFPGFGRGRFYTH